MIKRNAFFICILTLAIISYFSLFLLMFYFPFVSHQKELTPSFSATQQTNSYLSDWNIFSSAQENYYASSDHSAFGEGSRYSVLSGSISLSNSTCNRQGDRLSKTTGNGADISITWFLNDVWDALDVPAENRCTIAKCDWTLFRTNNGSKLLIATTKNSNTVYIAEQIL